MRFAQHFLLVLIAGSLMMAAILCLGDHSPLAMKGGARFICEAAVSFVTYGFAVLTVHRFVHSRRAYVVGFLAGIVCAGLQVVHMSMEVFGTHLGERTGITLLFMGLSFAIWCSAAVRLIRYGSKTGEALFAAIFSAVTTMVVAVAYGILLSAAGYPDTKYVSTWPEFAGSGWSDARSFAIANSLEAAASHFLAAPIIGLLVGGIGIVIALGFRRAGVFTKDGKSA
jgi:hypothetical protein